MVRDSTTQRATERTKGDKARKGHSRTPGTASAWWIPAIIQLRRARWENVQGHSSSTWACACLWLRGCSSRDWGSDGVKSKLILSENEKISLLAPDNSFPLPLSKTTQYYWYWLYSLGVPCGSAGKESTCNAGNLGSIPGLGRSPGEGKGCHGLYDMYGVTKSRTRPSDFDYHHTHLEETKQHTPPSITVSPTKLFTLCKVPRRVSRMKCYSTQWSTLFQLRVQSSLQQWKRQPLTQAGKGNDDSLPGEIPSRPSENNSRKNGHVGFALRQTREGKARDGTEIEVKSLGRRKVQQSKGSRDTGTHSKGKKLRTEVLSVLVTLGAEDLICTN